MGIRAPYLIQHIDLPMNIQNQKVVEEGQVDAKWWRYTAKWSNMTKTPASFLLGQVSDAWRGYMNGQRRA